MTEPGRPSDADLARWCDAVRSDELPEPLTERWTPLRAGVVNLWEFDVAEYWFAGGRAQLVGQNQSGKSSLMTLTSLIMLAGDLDPGLVDTFGERHKSFRYYVEPTRDPTDRRDAEGSTARGWTWVELGRRTPDGPRFFTLLLYAQAKRGTELGKTWGTVEGEARVRSGITLRVGTAVLAPDEVARLEPASTGTIYRQRLAERLFGFSGTERLDAVVRILKVLRTPHLGQRLDPDFFTERMREALLALDTGEVDKLADGWDELERLAGEREEALAALEATRRFVRRAWEPWADAVLRRYGDVVVSANRRFDDVTRDERQARARADAAEAAALALDSTVGARRHDLADAQDRWEAHLTSPAYLEAAAAVDHARQLEQQAAEALGRSQAARGRLQEAEQVVDARERERATSQRVRDERSTAVDREVAAVVRAGTRARFAEGWERWVEGHDLTRLSVLVAERRTQTEAVRRLLSASRVAQAHAEQADQALADVETALDSRRAAAHEAEARLEDELRRLSEHLEAWAAALAEDAPDLQVREGWIAAVEEQVGTQQPMPVLAALVRVGWLTPLRDPLRTRAALESELARTLRADADVADAEADALDASTEPEASVPRAWTRRARPVVGSEGAPLWWLLDPVPGLPAPELDRIEAALDAMGLLDAWVTADGIWREDRDGAELVLAPGAVDGPPVRALGLVLRSEGDGPAAVAAAALAAIGWGESLPPAGDAAFAIATDGRWRTPLASGRVDPAEHGAELIGSAARTAARTRRIAALRAAAQERREQARTAQERAAAAERRSAALEQAASELDDTPAVRLALAAVAARTELTRAEEAREAAAERQQRALERADDARASLVRSASGHRLPDDEDALAAVAAAVDATESATGLLRAALVAHREADERLGGAERLLAEAVRLADRDRADLAAEEDRTRTARIRAETAAARLADPDRDLLSEGDRLDQARRALGDEVERLATELQGQVRVRDAAAEVLRRTTEDRQRAVTERDQAVRDWTVAVDAGLAEARGLDGGSGASLTAALSASQAARARLRPSGWPDGPDPVGKQRLTEQAFARLVTLAGELGRQLQALGGRSVTVENPAEPDALPQVLLRVDLLGGPLAPGPALEALEHSATELAAAYDSQLASRLEELLSSTFVEHLRLRLAGVIDLVGKVNAVLATHPTGANRTTLRLARIPAPGQQDGFAVLEALAGPMVGVEGAKQQIRTFLEQRIRQAQQDGSAGETDWKSHLADLLDYRQWFSVVTEYSVVGAGSGEDGDGRPARRTWRPLTRQVHARDSGGGKAVTLMQPLLATLVALYAEAPGGPRPLWLDEAFTGVDDGNRVTMLDLLVDFDLDFLAAGPDTLVAVSAVPSAAIWHVTRAPAPVPGVDLALTLWAGDRSIALPTPDADPLTRPPSPVDRSLFDEGDEGDEGHDGNDA